MIAKLICKIFGHHHYVNHYYVGTGQWHLRLLCYRCGKLLDEAFYVDGENRDGGLIALGEHRKRSGNGTQED